MGKKTKKVSVNLTEEEYKLLEILSIKLRRTISELSALILMDNAQALYCEMQEVKELYKVRFTPSKEWEESSK